MEPYPKEIRMHDINNINAGILEKKTPFQPNQGPKTGSHE